MRCLSQRRIQAQRSTALALLVTALFGCGWNDDKGLFVERRDDYLDAKEGVDLLVPEDLSKAALGEPFPIPPTPEQTDAEFFPFKPPLPDAIYGDDTREAVRIQSLGERRWLVVPEPPATVWPKIKQFFTDNGVAIAAENPQAGRIDSQWLELTDAGYRDVIRTVLRDARTADGVAAAGPAQERVLLRVEQGLRDRTSEIHLRQQRVPEAAQQMPLPQPLQIGALSSASALAERQMLSELGAFIVARVAEQTVSMVGQSISTQPKSVMERVVDGAPALRLNLDFARAWATVGQALANAGVEVEDSDEANASYRIVITEETFTGNEKGFFGRVFSFGKKSEELVIKILPVTEELLDAPDGAFRIQVQPLQADADPVPRELAQDVLVMIREFAG